MDAELFKECQDELQEDEYIIGIEEQMYNIRISRLFLMVAPGISIISLFTSLIITVFLLYAMVKKRISTRQYMPILNRTFGDVVLSIIIILFGIIGNVENAYFSISVLSLVISTFGIINCSLSHLLYIIIRQISHERIGFFNEYVKTNKVIIAGILLILCSFLYSAMFSPMYVALSDPLYANDVCQYYGCQNVLVIISIVVMGILILTTLIIYLIVLRKLYKSIKDERSRNELPVSKYKFKKFVCYGGSILLYLIISILIFIGMIFILKSLSTIDNILYPKIQCNIINYMSIINKLQSISGGIILLWIVRMIFDPIILLSHDFKKIIPWISSGNEVHQLDEVHSTFSSASQPSESLRWRRHCPIMEMERTISAWDIKN